MAQGLPRLPGYNFNDVTRREFQRSNHFYLRGGHTFQNPDATAPGRKELEINSVAFVKKPEPINFDPSLTYGRNKSKTPSEYVPYYVQYANKSLLFRAFFKQSVYESPLEHFRVRYVNIIYSLEDDTIAIMEKPINDAGFPQGKLLRRCKVPKNDCGDYYHWKDFNVGIDIAIYGFVYHITDADPFTREFLQSQGMDVNQAEDEPPDTYLQNRLMTNYRKQRTTPVVDDKLRRYLEFDGKILRFDCVWDDRDREHGELLPHKLYYYLADDTVMATEVRRRNDGREPFPKMLRRIKLPKIWTDRPVTYAPCYMELTDGDVTEYYQPKDFLVGETVFILGRRFLIVDCDKFTRMYYKKMLGIEQKPKIDWEPPPPPPVQQQVPPHVTGIGSQEDSLLYCFKLTPKRPKSDVIKRLNNLGNYLNYTAKLVSAHPEDSIREFVFTHDLSDSGIRITEPPIRNSGIWGGRFLQKTLIPKPNTDVNCPEYYTPADFYIGALIGVYGHVFRITGADLKVLRYMESNPEKFSPESISNVRNYMCKEGYLKEDLETQLKEDLLKEKRDELATIGTRVIRPENELDVCKQKLEKMSAETKPISVDQYEPKSPIIVRNDDRIAPPPTKYGIQGVVTDQRYPVHIGGEIESVECTKREPKEDTNVCVCAVPKTKFYPELEQRENELADILNTPTPKTMEESQYQKVEMAECLRLWELKLRGTIDHHLQTINREGSSNICPPCTDEERYLTKLKYSDELKEFKTNLLKYSDMVNVQETGPCGKVCPPCQDEIVQKMTLDEEWKTKLSDLLDKYIKSCTLTMETEANVCPKLDCKPDTNIDEKWRKARENKYTHDNCTSYIK